MIHTSIRKDGDNGYEAMAEEMEVLAKKQTGYLGVESAREYTGIAVSYWESLEAIAAWKNNSEYLLGQSKGIKD